MNTKEKKPVSVGFRFNKTPAAEMADRLSRARQLLTSRGGTFTEIQSLYPSGTLEVVLLAFVPGKQALEHHGFDSILNKAWPEGCGAGWVTEGHE